MTNDEKERLKEMLRESFSVPTEDADFLCGLLDRQPSEKEARIAMGFLRGKIMPNCAWQRKIVSCCQCDWHDDCKSVIKTFRKSLNIEGKE